MSDVMNLERQARHIRPATHDEVVQALAILVRHIANPPVPEIQEQASDPWLTPAEAARYAAVSDDTLRAWIHSGVLAAGRKGRIIRIKRSDIDAMLRGTPNDTGSSSMRDDGSSQPSEERSAADEAVSEAATDILKRMRRKRTR